MLKMREIRRQSGAASSLKLAVGLGTCIFLFPGFSSFVAYRRFLLLYVALTLNDLSVGKIGRVPDNPRTAPSPLPTTDLAVSGSSNATASRHTPAKMLNNQKIQRQPGDSASVPPRIGPTAVAMLGLQRFSEDHCDYQRATKAHRMERGYSYPNTIPDTKSPRSAGVAISATTPYPSAIVACFGVRLSQFRTMLTYLHYQNSGPFLALEEPPNCSAELGLYLHTGVLLTSPNTLVVFPLCRPYHPK
jgi:hypothetical protein